MNQWLNQCHLGDCLDVLREMPDSSVDAVVTDPPYGLSFMGKRWDYDVPAVEVWAECLRVLKPGGYLLSFAGTRTQHRMACRIEDAGFEIRDMIAWVYGCLDEATEVATDKGVIPYHKAKIGDRALCYDVEHGEYTYQPILEIVEYNYSDTAFRLVGDFGEQVVSRNHRVIVERGGSEAFQIAETLECEACVPVLESLPALRQALHDAHQGAGRPQQGVQCDLCECVDRCSECRDDASGTAQGRDDQVLGLRGACVEAGCVAAQGGDADMQQEVQRRSSRGRVGEPCLQGAGEMEAGIGSRAEGAHDGRVQPGLEGRADVSQPEGRLRGSADQVRAMPLGSEGHGAGGRLCDGAPSCGGTGSRAAADANGVRAPHQPRCDGQPAGKSDVVRDEWTAQGVRAWGGHRSAVVRVVPFHYTGKVWCLRVPTGAFVAVRNGVAFPTGNSGFPKSLDVSKAIDKARRRDYVQVALDMGLNLPGRNVDDWTKEGHAPGDKWWSEFKAALPPETWQAIERRVIGSAVSGQSAWFARGVGDVTAPATDAAQQWQGWGTALKPALEPITMARKPLIGTVAANVAAHGTGALNIDACRVGSESTLRDKAAGAGQFPHEDDAWEPKAVTVGSDVGRWPANLIHDGSDEVVALFPQSAGQQGDVRGTEPSGVTNGIYGDFAGRVVSAARNDTGSAARFFYCAKASGDDRNEGLHGFATKQQDAGRKEGNPGGDNPRNRGLQARKNHHPTVKPTDLMRYLARLVTPAGGIVLDPFMGSGTTCCAAVLEGLQFIGIEREAEYIEIARARISSATRQGFQPSLLEAA